MSNNVEAAIAAAEVMPEEECNAEFKIRQTHHELVDADDGESHEEPLYTEYVTNTKDEGDGMSLMTRHSRGNFDLNQWNNLFFPLKLF